MADDSEQYLANGWWQRTTLDERVRELAESRGEGTAFAWADTRMSWADYDICGYAIAERLAGLGIEQGNRVLVLLPDGGGVHATFLGCERAGAISVGIGWRAGRRELEAVVRKTCPAAMVTTTATPLGSAKALQTELGVDRLVLMEDLDGRPHPSLGPAASPRGGIGASDLWLINSTSGTTGLPKCVMQHQNRWFYFHQKAVEFGELSARDSFMSVVPAPFGFGLWTSHFSPTLLGVSCHVQPRFDARAAAMRIAEEGISVLCAVSSQFVMILDAASDLDLSSLRVLFTGGERLPLERSREFEERTGCAVLNFYGSNETGVLSGTRTSDPIERRIASGGRCVPEMNVRLYDDQLERIPGDRGMGRPACRGPATSPGYYEDAAANRELLTEDGWMLMGDYVEIDDEGWLTVIGRSADFIVRGGKNISAAAVEEEVCAHAAVEQAAAVAIPDRRLGEIVGVCVSLRSGQALSLDDLKHHLEARGVTKEWWPERLAILDEMPRSSGGKIAKGDLRDRVHELF